MVIVNDVTEYVVKEIEGEVIGNDEVPPLEIE